MGRLLRALRHLGTRPDMDPRLARRVVLANSIALTLGAVTLPYAVIFWLMGARALAVAVVPIALVYVVTPFVAARVSFGAARAVMFTTFPLAVFAYASSFGERAGIQLLLFAAVCMPVLLCELRERAALAHGLGMSVAAFLVLELSEYSLLGAPVVGPWVQQIVRLAIVATTFVFLLTAVFYFALSSRRAEASLDGRNRAMRLVLDHVEQGLVTVEADGRLLPERSAAADRWLGVPAPGESLVELTRAHDPGYADWLALGLATLAEDALPVEVVLDQLPARLAAGGRVLEPSYKPIDGSNGRLLVMFTDVTARLERERAEEQQAEVVALVTRALADRGVVRACLAEARELIDRLVSGASAAAGADAVARDLHTLKGNAALFGLGSVARLCHGVEDACAETRAPPTTPRSAPSPRASPRSPRPCCRCSAKAAGPRCRTTTSSGCARSSPPAPTRARCSPRSARGRTSGPTAASRCSPSRPAGWPRGSGATS